MRLAQIIGMMGKEGEIIVDLSKVKLFILYSMHERPLFFSFFFFQWPLFLSFYFFSLHFILTSVTSGVI